MKSGYGSPGVVCGVAVLYQVGMPAAMIAGRERVLREGEVIRRSAPRRWIPTTPSAAATCGWA
jgi:hypothetical protein